MKRVPALLLMRVALLLAMLLPTSEGLAASHVVGHDEIILKNGRRYSGRILRDTPESLVLAVNGGTVEFPRSSVAFPPSPGTREEAPAALEGSEASAKEIRRHPLPSIAGALLELQRFAWASDVKQVPALVTDRGRWQFLPCVSFWAGGFARISFYGDPERPAAIEVSLLEDPEKSWERKRELLEFILSLEPALALDDRFDQLDVLGDSFAQEDLWLAVTGPDNHLNPGRWVVLLLHEQSISASRASVDELKSISEPISAATLDPARPRSWQQGSWTVREMEWLRQTLSIGHVGNVEEALAAQAWTALGGERVFVRSFVREGGRYARSSNDWLPQVANAGRP